MILKRVDTKIRKIPSLDSLRLLRLRLGISPIVTSGADFAGVVGSVRSSVWVCVQERLKPKQKLSNWK